MKRKICFYLKGFPLLNPKLELTIMAIQKAMKITRKTTSLHFLLCLMIPFPFPAIWAVPSLDGYLPMTAPKGPLIFSLNLLQRENKKNVKERDSLKELKREFFF